MGDEKYFSNLFVLLLLIVLPWSTSPTFTRELLCSLSLFPSGQYIGWESKKLKEDYIKNGFYVPKNILPTRFKMYNSTVFLTLPRFRCGVPFSLGAIFMNDYCKAEPLMYPYPNWFTNKYGVSGAINNAVDIEIDSNKLLWVLDVGIINTLTNPEYIETPRVLGICLQTGQISRIINLSSLVSATSRFQYIQVEIIEGKTFVYISDAGSNAIIVWDVNQGHGYKVALPATMHEGGCRVQDDVLYIELLGGKCATTSLYFTYLNSKRLFHIDTVYLRSGITEGVVEDDGPKPGRIVLLGTDKGLNLFFRQRGKSDVFYWNSSKDFRSPNLLLAQPIDSGRFPTHVSSGYRSLMWTLESNFPDYMADQINEMGPSAKIHPTMKFCDDEII